ncbi:protein PET117 homolog, mitochondrial [Pleuronectes platessa]|uniref:protein PET117 homolog, mitochondrial n=1 Tax=Pleuronectes platessa TaxID=8262 RepID=UPI00232A3130|nr:protein PET117 homolog, mitochondrial [Pleuronectes platessa]XP_062244421.1 protein PET117 homolog, mitochondrial [Platichthys flesus]
MSAASRLALGVSVVLTLSTVAAVHLNQAWDRQRLHEGVVRDLERWERKKENLRRLEEQKILGRRLKEERDRAPPTGAALSQVDSGNQRPSDGQQQ